MSKRNGSINIVLGVLVVILAATVGFLLYKQKGGKVYTPDFNSPATSNTSADTTTKNQTTTVATSTPTTTAPVIETPKVPTYTNTLFNYSFTYPKNYVVFSDFGPGGDRVISAAANAAQVQVAQDSPQLYCCQYSEIYISATSTNSSATDWVNQHKGEYILSSQAQSSVKATTLGGKTAVELQGPGNDFGVFRLYVVDLGSKLLLLAQNSPDTNLEKVVTNFKFTK